MVNWIGRRHPLSSRMDGSDDVQEPYARRHLTRSLLTARSYVTVKPICSGFSSRRYA